MSNPMVPTKNNKSKKKMKGNVAVEVSVGGLMTLLKVTKEVSGAFPPLQLAAGGLLAIAEIISKAASTQGSITELESYVGRLNAMIAEALPPTLDGCPEKLKKRMQTMASAVDTVASELRELKLPAFWRRAVTAESTNGKVQDAVQTLSWILNDFIVGGTIDIELAVDELQVAVHQGFERMDGRFDELVQKADEIVYHQENHDGLPSPRHVKAARWDYHNNRVICEENTRVEVLDAVCRWMRPDDARLRADVSVSVAILGPQGSPVFWLAGQAGTGKSTIAQTVAEWCDSGGHLGASFFCSRDSSECSNVQNIFPTIAYQLGVRSQTFRERLADVLRADKDLQDTAAVRQLEKLIAEPLELVEDFPPSVVIIDALDECRDDQTTSRILLALSHWVPRLRPLTFFITSRPEQHIRQGFFKTGLVNNTQHLVLNEISQRITEHDIRTYLRRQLADIALRYSDVITDEWPLGEQVDALAKQTHRLFIFAATAIKFIGDDRAGDPKGLLNVLLRSQQPLSSESPQAHLDTLYLQVLRSAFPRMDELWMARLRMVLGSLVLVRDRLSSTTLESLLGLEQGTVRGSLRRLHSLIIVPDGADQALRLIHPSFHDFLTDPVRCTDREFVVNSKIQHTVIAQKCLETLNGLLHRDVCDIGDPSKLNVEVPDLPRRVAAKIPSHVQYACRHWASHLAEGTMDERVFELLRTFCEQHLLHWLEVMSLLGALGDALDGLVIVEVSLQALPLPPSDVLNLLHDCERVIRYFHPGLAVSCLQAYYGVAPFCPTSTKFHRWYLSHVSSVAGLVIGAQASWNACIHTLEGHTNAVMSVAFSPGGDRIVSSSHDKTVRIWNAKSGAHLQTFTEHSDHVNTASFHPSGRLVFSASGDRTVVWDTLTGGVLQALHDERTRGPIVGLAISSDGRLLAHGSMDGQVYLWSMDASAEYQVWCVLGDGDTANLGMNTDIVSLIFSRDTTSLVSANLAGVCTAWDIRSKSATHTYRYIDTRLRNIALSSDEQHLAGGYYDGAVVVWKFRGSSTPARVLKPSADPVWSVQFSPTEGILASGHENGSIYLWSLARGQCVGSLFGHTNSVNNISFSPDGRRVCSAGSDATIRVWTVANIGSTTTHITDPSPPGTHAPLPRRLHSRLHSLVPSREEQSTKGDSHIPADIVVHDAAHHSEGPVRAVAFSPDGRTLATGAGDGLVKLWSTQTGLLLRDLAGHEKLVSCISFSRDGRLLASGGHFDNRVIVWDSRTGRRSAAEGHDGSVMQVTFLRDNVRLVSSSADGTLRSQQIDTTTARDVGSNNTSVSRIWTMDMPGPGLYMDEFVFAVSDDECLIAFSVTLRYDDWRHHDTILRVLQLDSKTVIWSMPSQQGNVALSFASNGLTLAALSSDGLVQCFTRSQSTADFGGYEPTYQVPTCEGGFGTVRFSSDDRWIITDSALVDTYGHTLRLSQHDTTPDVSLSSFPRTILLRDQWLWRTSSSGGPPHRACWVPRGCRFDRWREHRRGGSMAVHRDLVALGTESGRVVLVDLSQAL